MAPDLSLPVRGVGGGSAGGDWGETGSDPGNLNNDHPAASASANWKPPFWTIPQPEIMKNWPTCIRQKRNLPGRVSAMTRRFHRAPIHRILFTDARLLK